MLWLCLCQCEIWLVFSLIRELITLLPATHTHTRTQTNRHTHSYSGESKAAKWVRTFRCVECDPCVCLQACFLHILTCEWARLHLSVRVHTCDVSDFCVRTPTSVPSLPTPTPPSTPVVVAGKWFHRLLAELQHGSEWGRKVKGMERKGANRSEWERGRETVREREAVAV